MARRRSGPEVLAAAGDLVVQRDAARASGRLLRQGDMDASYVDLADPRHLEFDYLRRMRDLVEALRARRVSTSAAAAARWRGRSPRPTASAARTSSRSTPRCWRSRASTSACAARRGCACARSTGARSSPAARDGSADAILVDAFVGARVPRHLVTAEALADAARVVAPAARWPSTSSMPRR